MKISAAEFVMSNTNVARCPNEPLPEYAFIGRSNVGKSSLINMLTERTNLAKTSGRPGKTQLINHFRINKNWFLVDLPGYGYAKTSKKIKKTFQTFITAYFLKRKQLISGFLLIDIRHEPQEIDLNFMRWLGENGVPFALIFTKADKLKSSEAEAKVARYRETLLQGDWAAMPPYFITSATKKSGRDEVLAYIDQLNRDFAASRQE